MKPCVDNLSITINLMLIFRNDVYHTDMDTAADPSNKISSDNTCHLCGITFANKDEKEEHMKLEHSEHKQPSGVS
jgi:hypothetical protein